MKVLIAICLFALLAVSHAEVNIHFARMFENMNAASESDNRVSCQYVTEDQIASLFDRWNESLQTLEPAKVVANYADTAILLPTVSNTPRLTTAQRLNYFESFLKNKPSGVIDMRNIQIGCNSAIDAGIYTFTFGATGAKVQARYTYTYGWDAESEQWLITSHHSSAMPEPVSA